METSSQSALRDRLSGPHSGLLAACTISAIGTTVRILPILVCSFSDSFIERFDDMYSADFHQRSLHLGYRIQLILYSAEIRWHTTGALLAGDSRVIWLSRFVRSASVSWLWVSSDFAVDEHGCRVHYLGIRGAKLQYLRSDNSWERSEILNPKLVVGGTLTRWQIRPLNWGRSVWLVSTTLYRWFARGFIRFRYGNTNHQNAKKKVFFFFEVAGLLFCGPNINNKI